MWGELGGIHDDLGTVRMGDLSEVGDRPDLAGHVRRSRHGD